MKNAFCLRILMNNASEAFRTACRIKFRWLTVVSLIVGGIFSPLRAADPRQIPQDQKDSPSSGLEFTIEPSAQGMVLTWFGQVGVPFQVQSSTDLKKWTDVGPIIGGTNGWISIPIATTEEQLAS